MAHAQFGGEQRCAASAHESGGGGGGSGKSRRTTHGQTTLLYRQVWPGCFILPSFVVEEEEEEEGVSVRSLAAATLHLLPPMILSPNTL